MHHFLALVWDSRDAAATAASRRLLDDAKRGNPAWTEVFCDLGLVVLERPPFVGSTHAQRLPKNAGVVLGRVFPTSLESWTPGWTWAVTEPEVDRIIETQGSSMMEMIWGGYIAILYDRARHGIYVARDCSGKIPCYRAQHCGVEIVFSELQDLDDLNLPTFTVNFAYVTAFLCSSQLQIRDTGLNEVTELLAGDCFKMQSGVRSQRSLWQPSRMFALLPIDDFETAVAEVRFTFQRCVDAWASAYERISVSLSGGLDSAVVLGCLRRAKHAEALTCFNRYGLTESEDERFFARKAAAAAEVRLSELPFLQSTLSIDERLYQSALTAKPTIPWVFANLDIEYYQALSHSDPADSMWTGQGGDHLFLQTRSPLGARDYLNLKGINLGLLSAVDDARRLSGQPYWTTLATLVARQKAGSNSKDVFGGRESTFLASDAQAKVPIEYLTHPWMSGSERLTPGRRFQVAALCEVLNRHRPLPGLEPVYEHHPLLSQPLLELCLRIPSYTHLCGGVDRAVEKAAFREVVPAEILLRKRKGQSTMSLFECLHRSGAFIRELLLDGHLVREGMLDRRRIEPYLRHERPMRIADTFPLISCIAAELWVRTWVAAGHCGR